MSQSIPFELSEGLNICWGGGQVRYRLEFFKAEHPADPLCRYGRPPVKMLFWGDEAKARGLPSHGDGEQTIRELLTAYVSDADAIRSIRAGGLKSRLRAVEADGLFNIYEDVGDPGMSRWQLRYLGIEPDGVVRSSMDDLEAVQRAALLTEHTETISLRVNARGSSVWDCGPFAGKLRDGIAIIDQEAAIRATDCDPADWRKAAGKLLACEVYRYSAFLQGEVFETDLHDETAGMLARHSGVVYGSDVSRNGLLDMFGLDLKEAVEAGAYTLKFG